MTGGIRSTLLALWLGAALLFGVVVAPTVFTVLRSFDLPNANEIAGAIVTGTLAVINVGGFVIGLISLAIALLKRTSKGLALIVELASLGTLVVTTALGHWVIAARMHTLRAAMVTIDVVSPADPRRVEFNDLHHYSVVLLGIAMIAVLVAQITQARENWRKM